MNISVPLRCREFKTVEIDRHVAPELNKKQVHVRGSGFCSTISKPSSTSSMCRKRLEYRIVPPAIPSLVCGAKLFRSRRRAVYLVSDLDQITKITKITQHWKHVSRAPCGLRRLAVVHSKERISRVMLSQVRQNAQLDQAMLARIRIILIYLVVSFGRQKSISNQKMAVLVHQTQRLASKCVPRTKSQNILPHGYVLRQKQAAELPRTNPPQDSDNALNAVDLELQLLCTCRALR
jgi:hypothetical protein